MLCKIVCEIHNTWISMQLVHSYEKATWVIEAASKDLSFLYIK